MKVFRMNNQVRLALELPEGATQITLVDDWLPYCAQLRIDPLLRNNMIRESIESHPQDVFGISLWKYSVDPAATPASALDGLADRMREERLAREVRYDKSLAALYLYTSEGVRLTVMGIVLSQLVPLVQAYKEMNHMGIAAGGAAEGILDFVQGTPGTTFASLNLGVLGVPQNVVDMIKNILLYGLEAI